jgi:eukaryotic-like serine/threonine-protein kinase
VTSHHQLNSLPVGFVIGTRYEVRSTLGTGSHGIVYEVFDHRTGQTSALKFLLSFNPNSPWIEAEVLVGLEGEFVLPVRNAHHESGVPYIVTEVARNGTVSDRLVAGVGVPTDQTIKWVQQASRGTARIHDRGLLHNDIKPANLFLAANDEAMIGDLGIATLRDASGHGGFGGTPNTMAPEVAVVGATLPPAAWPSRHPTSIASDVYSLGATLYWLLAGQPPHQDPTGLIETMRAVTSGPPPDLLDVAPHVPQGVRDIVQKAMARDPADRYGGPAALDAALGSRSHQTRTWTMPRKKRSCSCIQVIQVIRVIQATGVA